MKCSYPIPPGVGRTCDRPAVAVYYLEDGQSPRCKRHDNERARARAKELGYERREIAP